ncbi:MAG TPA: hypothetical protein VFG71_13500 [Nitrospiraceae bacterium]|nr:hypothetical protein [Nitrospiraceae bacterium]
MSDDTLVTLRLDDVHLLHGGQNIMIWSDGTELFQLVARRQDASGLYEKRYKLVISSEGMRHLTQVLIMAAAAEPPTTRHGFPDEPRPMITATFLSGISLRLSKWADDKHREFDGLYAALLSEIDKGQQTTPIYEGPYDPHWLPDRPSSPSRSN